jgi:hypothetical protein
MEKRELISTSYVLSDDPETAHSHFKDLDSLFKTFPFSDSTLKWISKTQAKKRETKVENTLIIVDDVDHAEKSKEMEAVFKRGRHLGLNIFLLNQVANRSLTPTAKVNSNFILFSALTPKTYKELHEEMVVSPPFTPKEFSDWCAANVGGPPGSPNYRVFGVYDRTAQALYKIKA